MPGVGSASSTGRADATLVSSMHVGWIEDAMAALDEISRLDAFEPICLVLTVLIAS